MRFESRPRAIGSGEIRQMAQYRNLIHLAITSSELNTTDAVEIARNFPELRSLDLSSNQIEDKGAYEIIQNLLYLTHLNLSLNWISNDTAKELNDEIKHITDLILSHNAGHPQLRDMGDIADDE